MLTFKRNRSSLLTRIVTIAILAISGLLLFNNLTTAQDVKQLAIDVSDLPEGSFLLSEGYLDFDDNAHPLSMNVSDSRVSVQQIYEYKSVYSFEAVTPVHGIMVTNYLYEYSDAPEAEKALSSLIEEGESAFVRGYTSERVDGLQGQAFKFIGNEGDSVYWFLGRRDNILIMLMTNGMDTDSAQEILDLAVHRLLQK